MESEYYANAQERLEHYQKALPIAELQRRKLGGMMSTNLPSRNRLGQHSALPGPCANRAQA